MRALEKIKTFVDKFLVGTLSIIIATILFCVCIQVFTRYFLRTPATFTEELVRFLLIWLGLLGASYGFGVKGHIALTLFFDKCPERIKNILDIFTNIMILILSIGILMFGGIKLMIITHNQTSAVLLLPIWIVYIVAPLSGLFTTFYQVYFIILKFISGGKKI